MGMYLVSIGAANWFGEGEDGWGPIASGLNEELHRRGLPPYDQVPEEAEFVRGSGQSFEEKLIPPMDGFGALCRKHLSRHETDLLCDWTFLVPISLEEPILLPVESAYGLESTIAGAPQALAVAERLAAAVDLPAEVPATSDNLDLTAWFLDGPAEELATHRPGPWSTDLDTAFYVALYLRAAQHSLRRGSPLTYI
ncbi:hypothetical protein DPM19_00940 [Actinomadura craniellae]|uniref:Uncharacterized protein n=1 Tax=Actinomadura craniellae TaxID=2231787 RepID=A0A365HGW2_9ACTN|nr:hypothetical protein [Actinomadura craniellae]RAY17273.1 hypothetical protein DPM19_00940 [Actinomadura craniellae]